MGTWAARAQAAALHATLPRMDDNRPGAQGPQADPAAPDPAPDLALEAFTALCQRLAGFDDRLHPEWVDGYLTATAASWRTITLDELLEPMTGDAYSRTFADPADDAQARAVLEARMAALRQALDPESLLDDLDALRLQPWMAVWDDAARCELVEVGHVTEQEAATFHTGQEWAAGFLQATVDFAADWPDPPEARSGDPEGGLYADLLGTVAALAWDPASEEFRAFAQAGWKNADPTRDEVIDEACFAVQELRLWWIDHPPKRPPRRVEAAPGRNDPCWCGSGRKFKKCHGVAA